MTTACLVVLTISLVLSLSATLSLKGHLLFRNLLLTMVVKVIWNGRLWQKVEMMEVEMDFMKILKMVLQIIGFKKRVVGMW